MDTSALIVLAQDQSGGGGLLGSLLPLVIVIVIFAGMWKMFEKAGQPGWAGIVPIYNSYKLCLIVGRPWWWFLLLFIPIVNFFVAIVLAHDTARSYGKGIGFTVGLVLLAPIFFCILGFGDAKYIGPAAAPK